MTLPVFQGARLQQAREVRQWTATALAERVGASGGAVSMWEKGTSQPRPGAREEIAKVLDLPEAFFVRPLSVTTPSVFRFRSLSAATKRARTAAEGRTKWLHDVSLFLGAEIDLPPVRLPKLDLPDDPQRLTVEDIERAAEATRAEWGLRDGPIPDLTKLVESRGIVVSRLALNAAELDGLSTWGGDGRPYVVLNSEKSSCARSRFDLAHEVAHLVLHARSTPRPDSPLHKLMEKQAHHFGASLIFPRTAVRDEVTRSDLDSLIRLKERWRLSIGAIVFRLFQLAIISESTKDHLQRLIGARGWKTREPLDDELQPERPSLLRQGYELLCSAGGWSQADIVRALPLATHDHEQLAGLPARWMQGNSHDYGELVKLRSEPGRASNTIDPATPAKVIRFIPRRD